MEIKAKFWIENKGEVVLGGGKTALLLRWIGLAPFNGPLTNLDVLPPCLGRDQKKSKRGPGLKLSIQIGWTRRAEGPIDPERKVSLTG